MPADKPMYANTSVYGTDGDHANCCWCGALIYGLKYDAKTANIPGSTSLRRFCQKCGKPNIISFRWSVDVSSRPEQSRG